MQNVATVYRFKTPFLDVGQEISKVKEIIECTINYIKSEWLEYNTYLKKTNELQVFVIEIKNIWKLIFAYLVWAKLLKEKFYPIFTMLQTITPEYIPHDQGYLMLINNCFYAEPCDDCSPRIPILLTEWKFVSRQFAIHCQVCPFSPLKYRFSCA